MLVRYPLALLIALPLLIAGCGGGSGGPGITPGAPTDPQTSNELAGDWGGQLSQKGLPPFTVAVRFDPTQETKVAYTGIDCGGTWRAKVVLDSNPPYYSFEEVIDEGAGGECRGTGTVQLHPLERCANPGEHKCGYRRIRYRFTGGGVTSKGILKPIAGHRLTSVFDQAGVTPPN